MCIAKAFNCKLCLEYVPTLYYPRPFALSEHNALLHSVYSDYSEPSYIKALHMKIFFQSVLMHFWFLNVNCVWLPYFLECAMTLNKVE